MTPTERHAERDRLRSKARKAALAGLRDWFAAAGGPMREPSSDMVLFVQEAVITALAQVERETLERAAKVAADYVGIKPHGPVAARIIATEIRALSPSTDKGEPK